MTSHRLVDKPGLLLDSTPELSPAQGSFARSSSVWAHVLEGGGSGKRIDLLAVIESVHPNVLIGTSTVPKAFTEEIVRAMAAHAERPIILPLSNPTRLHEATPADLLRWTKGRALVATGSPFAPGIGLGSVLCRASRGSDGMLVAAVRGVADMAPALREGEDATVPLLPGVRDVREVSVRVAREVIRAAVKEGLATEDGLPAVASGDGDHAELDEWIRAQMWSPEYRPLKKVTMEGASRQAKGEMRQVGTLARREPL